MKTGKYCKYTAKEILQHPEKYQGENGQIKEESKSIEKLSPDQLKKMNPDQEILSFLNNQNPSKMALDLNSVYIGGTAEIQKSPTQPVEKTETVSMMKKLTPLKYYQISNAVKTSCGKAIDEISSKKFSNSYEIIYSAAGDLMSTLK